MALRTYTRWDSTLPSSGNAYEVLDIFHTDGHNFQIGTCRGQFSMDYHNYYLETVANSIPHNGHFALLMQSFENFARRESRGLVILHVLNPSLEKALTRRNYCKWSGKHASERDYPSYYKSAELLVHEHWGDY